MGIVISNSWAPEYGGPAELLKDRRTAWLRRGRISEDGDGKWVWTAVPRFVANEAFEDFAELRAAGYNVFIHPANNALHIRISEREDNE